MSLPKCMMSLKVEAGGSNTMKTFNFQQMLQMQLNKLFYCRIYVKML